MRVTPGPDESCGHSYGHSIPQRSSDDARRSGATVSARRTPPPTPWESAVPQSGGSPGLRIRGDGPTPGGAASCRTVAAMGSAQRRWKGEPSRCREDQRKDQSAYAVGVSAATTVGECCGQVVARRGARGTRQDLGRPSGKDGVESTREVSDGEERDREWSSGRPTHPDCPQRCRCGRDVHVCRSARHSVTQRAGEPRLRTAPNEPLV